MNQRQIQSRRHQKDDETTEERRVGWYRGVSDFPMGKTQIGNSSSSDTLTIDDPYLVNRETDVFDIPSSTSISNQRPLRKAALDSNVRRRLIEKFGDELDDIIQGGSVENYYETE